MQDERRRKREREVERAGGNFTRLVRSLEEG